MNTTTTVQVTLTEEELEALGRFISDASGTGVLTLEDKKVAQAVLCRATSAPPSSVQTSEPEPLLYARCVKHYQVPQLNKSEAMGCECGACIAEAVLCFEVLRTANVLRCDQSFHPCHDWSETDWATAMAGECGEACNFIKKRRRKELITEEEVGKELADVVIYADLLAHRLGISLGDAVRQKFNEVSVRVNSPIRL